MSSKKNNVADLLWKSPGSDIEILGVEVEESVSDLYRIRAEIKSPDQALTFGDMLHTEAELVIKCGSDLEDDRMLTGIITRFSQMRTRFGNIPNATAKRYLYEVEIRPKLWMLTRQYRSRVFQKMSSKDIVAQILGEHGVACAWKLQGSPEPREYCIQYNETDYNFVCRLMEGSGISFFFDHAEKKVVFTDHAGGHPDCSPTATAHYVEEKSPHLQLGGHEIIGDFAFEERVGTGTFTVQSYNYETSRINLETEAIENQTPCYPEVESYKHTLNYVDQGAGQSTGNLLKEAELAGRMVGHGNSSCRSFCAGYTMTMTGHFRNELNVRWLLLSTHIIMEQGRYQCAFTALPDATPYRPPRSTPAPKVYGLQTAMVTGPPGAKVYLDDLGRCKIQFHWDREGNKDDRSSMWVRVSNNYAGKDYGIQWIPRIGDEVLITFIDGNPDLPIVTGRVYNDFNTPPLGPAKKWQNTIKTIKDHHIIFDDEDGKEMVDIRSHKDMTTLVVNNDTQTVGSDRSITVGSNHTEAIGSNMTLNIGKNLTETVGKSMTLTITDNLSESAGKSRTVQVGASSTTTVGDNMTLTAGKNFALDAGKNANVTVADNLELGVGKKTDITIGGETTIQSDKNMTVTARKKAVITVKDQLTVKCGQASIILKKNGDIQVKGKKILIKGSGDIKVKGKKIALN